METFLFLLELAGTVAFAVSGAVLGIEKHMDIFGVGLLGITTAVGGGILRDLVVGLTPPRAFQDPIYLLVALGVSVVLFFPFVRRTIGRSKHVFDALMLIMDAAGLGIFTITGMNLFNPEQLHCMCQNSRPVHYDVMPFSEQRV